MNLNYINAVIEDYRRWIRQGRAQGVDVSDLECYLARWEYDRAQNVLEIEKAEHNDPRQPHAD